MNMTNPTANPVPGYHQCELNLAEDFKVAIRVDVVFDRHGNPQIKFHNGSCSQPNCTLSGYQYDRIQWAVNHMCYLIYGKEHNINSDLITEITEYVYDYTVMKTRQNEIARIEGATN